MQVEFDDDPRMLTQNTLYITEMVPQAIIRCADMPVFCG